MKDLPVDLNAALASSDWQKDFSWPISPSNLRDSIMSQHHEYLKWILSLSGKHKDIALLVGGRLLMRARLLYCVMRALEAQGNNSQFYGDNKVLHYVLGKGQLKPTTIPMSWSVPSLSFGRAIARTASWTSWRRLWQALKSSKSLAVSHNSLLCAELFRREETVGYESAEAILNRLSIESSPSEVDTVDLSRQAVDQILKGFSFSKQAQSRIAAILQDESKIFFDIAARTLKSLSKWSDAPVRLFAGTGGSFASRAISIEVIRRGGTVERFEHGGGAAMIDYIAVPALTEFHVSTNFTSNTSATAEEIKRLMAGKQLYGSGICKITGGNGDPLFKSIRHSTKHEKKTQRLMYISTLFQCMGSIAPPIMADVVYLDWQRRLIEALKAAGHDTIICPHPAAMPAGITHPLTRMVPFAHGNFEKAMDSADLFIFDYRQTTTLASAMCSDKPIVLIDFGLSPPSELARKEIGKRCYVIEGWFDERNLPQIKWGDLNNVIRNAPRRVDYEPIRSYLAGPSNN